MNAPQIFLLILFPSILATILFWVKVELPVYYEATSDGEIKVNVDVGSLDTPVWINTFRKIVQAPFDLNYYELCIENRSRIEKDDETQLVPVGNVIVKDISGRFIGSFSLPAGGIVCRPVINTKDLFLSSVEITVPLEILFQVNTKVHSDIVPFSVRPTTSDQVASSILFYLFWLSFVLLIINIKNWIIEENSTKKKI